MTSKTEERLQFLLKRYLKQLNSIEEESELWSYFDDPQFSEKIIDLLPNIDHFEDDAASSSLEPLQQAKILSLILQRQKIPKYQQLRANSAIAASILLILSVVLYRIFTHKPDIQEFSIRATEQLDPVNKAVILTLGDGKSVNLSTERNNFKKASDGSELIHRDNAIEYDETNQISPHQHTLTNYSAKKFSVTLSDGTAVDLDIGSSITYPTVFTANERVVTVSGQTYFNVKHNARLPFKVHVGDLIIEDIGTEFNIDAYNPSINTTLVQGAASITFSDQRVIVSKGEKVVFNKNSFNVSIADLEETVDWLKGDFVFNHESLESILSKVARVYDVSFTWKDESLKNLKFNGLVSRNKKLLNVLNFIRKTGPVEFKTDGKNIDVIIKQ